MAAVLFSPSLDEKRNSPAKSDHWTLTPSVASQPDDPGLVISGDQ